MPFAWNQIEPSRIGQVQKWDIPLNDWLGLKFSEGMSYGIGRAVWDFGEDLAYDEGKPEDPKILNKSFGIEGYLQFDKPITIGQAALLRERKLEELERMSYLEGASHSWKSTKAAAGFIAGLAGGFAHPADLGTSFIPFVGSSAKAAGLARIGGKGLVFDVLHSGRQAIARGLIAEEAIGAGKAAAFTASMMDGVLSQAAVEIPIALQKHRNQSDYTAEDSAFNILFGGVFAGGLHLAGRGVGKLFEMRMKAAADVHERLDPDTKEAIFREHQDAFVEGRRPDTERIVALDEAVIRERVAFDEAAARAEAEAIIRRESSQPRDASANELLDLAQAEASRGTQAGGILGRLVDRFMGGERTVEVLEQIAALTDRVYVPARIGPQESLSIKNVFGTRNEALKAVRETLKKARTELFQIEQVLPDILKRLHEAKGNEARQLRANASNLQARRAELIEAIEKSAGRTEDFRPLSGDELAGHQMAIDSRPSLVEKAQAERARRVSEYVDKKRKDWEATMEGRLSAERRAEIARQQEQGKLLPDDELAKYQAKPKVDAADVEMVMADVATLEKEIKDLAGLDVGAKQPVTGFKTAKGSTYSITESGTTIRNKAARPEHPGEVGIQPESEVTIYVSADDAVKLGEFQAQGGPKKAIAKRQDGTYGVKYLEGKDAGKFESRTLVKPLDGPAVGATPVELWKGGKVVHFGNEIVEVSGGNPKGFGEIAEEVQALLRKELAELDANVYTDQSPMVKAAAPCAAKFNG